MLIFNSKKLVFKSQSFFDSAPIFVEIFLRLVRIERSDVGVALAFSLYQQNFYVLKIFFVVIFWAQMQRERKGRVGIPFFSGFLRAYNRNGIAPRITDFVAVIILENCSYLRMMLRINRSFTLMR